MAGSKKASLILELKDMASAGIAKVNGALSSLTAVAAGVAASMAVLFAGMMKALAAYGEQESAISKLNNALSNQGIKSQAVTKDLIAFADQMQNTTVYADEVVLSAMALGVSFGLTGDKLKQATVAASNLASFMGTDLRQAMLLVGKAAAGETGTLSRLGIVIADNIPKSERYEAVIAKLNERFGGAASRETETYAGKMKQLGNSFDELWEIVGGFLAGPAKLYIGWLKDAAVYWKEVLTPSGIKDTSAMVNRFQKEADALDTSIARQKATIQSFNEEQARAGNKSYDKALADLASFEKAKAALVARHGKEIAEKPIIPQGKGPSVVDEEAAKKAEEAAKKAEEAAKKAEKEKQDLIEKATLQIDTANTTEEELTNIRTNAMAQELIDKGQQDLAIQLLDEQDTENKNAQDKKRTENAKKNSEQRSANIRSSLSTIATLTQSNNKTLFIAGKAAAISGATMDTYWAATKALLIQPPWVGIALAAGVTAAGMANVHNILATPMAEGGMIMPTSGGTLARMAEVGKAEVAIPLDDERTKEKLRDVMGGGGNTIVIQAGVVVADDYSLGEFADRIEEKLYERQRNRRSFL